MLHRRTLNSLMQCSRITETRKRTRYSPTRSSNLCISKDLIWNESSRRGCEQSNLDLLFLVEITRTCMKCKKSPNFTLLNHFLLADSVGNQCQSFRSTHSRLPIQTNRQLTSSHHSTFITDCGLREMAILQDIASTNLAVFPAKMENLHLLDYHESAITRGQSVDEMDKVVKIHPKRIQAIATKALFCMAFLIKSPFK